MSDVELIRAEIAALKVHIDGLEMLKLRVDALEARLTAAVAVEKEKREAEVAALRAEIDALREEWRNLATAISANSEAVAQVARRMQAECAQSNRPDLWTIFQGRVLRPALEGQPATDYTDLVRELGFGTPLDACRLLTTAKRMFSRNLRSAACEYAGAEGDADDEIEDLRKTLAGVGAQIGRRLRI